MIYYRFANLIITAFDFSNIYCYIYIINSVFAIGQSILKSLFTLILFAIDVVSSAVLLNSSLLIIKPNLVPSSWNTRNNAVYNILSILSQSFSGI